MKSTLLTIWALLILTTVGWTAEAPTIEFDSDQVRFAAESGSIGYQEFDPVSVGQSLTLPGRTYYIAIDDELGESAISYNITRSQELGSLPSQYLQKDIQTRSGEFNSDDNADTYDPINSSEAVHVVGQLVVDDSRYAKILFLPVTVSNSGELLLNESISIYLGQELLTGDQLLQTRPGASARAETAERIGLSAGSMATSYCIITAPQFEAPMQRLATYKNSLGRTTSVQFIDEILSTQSGRDEAEQLRNYLIQFYADGGAYVLLAGDASVLPIRYAYHRAVDETPDLSQQQVSDLYFADLTGEWDLDNDNVWGERTHDQADMTPELMVGRLPFNTMEQFDDYVDKLIAYETDPGDGDRDYLNRAFFFSSDQMRDYSGGGQHARISLAYPDNFEIDTTAGVEVARGDDLSPYNPLPCDVEEVLSDGYGIVNILAHGAGHIFEVRTSGYNQWPKTRFTTDTITNNNGVIGNLTPNGKTALYYSLSCDNGAFDYDYTNLPPNLVVTSLAQPKSGAVAFVANSRWGWVGSSHLMQRVFFDSLFAHPGRPAVAAMYESKLRYYYVRDVVYGQNFYGDPTLVIYDDVPGVLDVEIVAGAGQFEINVTSDGQPVDGCFVTLSDSAGVIQSVTTPPSGSVSVETEYDPLNTYTIAAVKTGYTVTRQFLSPLIAADAEDITTDNLPNDFSLSQNYPNPFNPTTTIRFELPYRTNVSISIYNVLGQHVQTMIDGSLSRGAYELTWDGRNDKGRQVTSGVYFYRLISENYTATKKLMLLR